VSSGPRIPLSEARSIAERVIAAWGIGEHTIVGSIRRECEDVGDIEICVPHPEPVSFYQGGRDGDRPAIADPLFERLASTLKLAGDKSLFASAGKFGREIKGVKHGFRYCQAEVMLEDGAAKRPITVEIHRYRQGSLTNRGWIVLMRTGPEEFSQAVLRGWKARHKRGIHHAGSEDGFLVDDAGRPFSTPDEMTIFNRLRALYVAPRDRLGQDSLLSADEWVQRAGGGRQRMAMGAFGIADTDQLKARIDEQRARTRELRGAQAPVHQETT
jgi:hypothetical protein